MNQKSLFFYFILDATLFVVAFMQAEWLFIQMLVLTQLTLALALIGFQIKFKATTSGRRSAIQRALIFVLFGLLLSPLMIVTPNWGKSSDWSGVGQIMLGSLGGTTLLAAVVIAILSVIGSLALRGGKNAH